MSLSQDILDAITAFRKENEDLVQANIRKIYRYKYGEETLSVGENTVSFPVEDDTAYPEPESYNLILYATDADGVDITASIIVTENTTSGFKVDSPRIGTLIWESSLKIPDFNFHT